MALHVKIILGINIQFLQNGKLVLKTLAMEEMNLKHTGENLKNVVSKTIINCHIIIIILQLNLLFYFV